MKSGREISWIKKNRMIGVDGKVTREIGDRYPLKGVAQYSGHDV